MIQRRSNRREIPIAKRLKISPQFSVKILIEALHFDTQTMNFPKVGACLTAKKKSLSALSSKQILF